MSLATSDNSLPADAPEAPDEWKRILEAVLLSAREPLSLAELRKVRRPDRWRSAACTARRVARGMARASA